MRGGGPIPPSDFSPTGAGSGDASKETPMTGLLVLTLALAGTMAGGVLAAGPDTVADSATPDAAGNDTRHEGVVVPARPGKFDLSQARYRQQQDDTPAGRGASGQPSGPATGAVFDEAVRLLFAAQPVESARRFDQVVAAMPAAEPQLWQRGLALYYAERFADGVKQFDLHRTVNPNDVENAAWHFACAARLEGPQAARARLLPVGADARVPMTEIMQLYAGRCGPDAVLAAAEQGAAGARRNQQCYAHLYLGLFFEATGDATKARHHMTQAAGAFSMNHFMGTVAAVHCRLRGWSDRAGDETR